MTQYGESFVVQPVDLCLCSDYTGGLEWAIRGDQEPTGLPEGHMRS